MPMNKKKQEQCRDLYETLLPNISDYIEKYAREIPDQLALIEYNTDEKITWKEFNNSINLYAAKLLSAGIGKGDIVATSLTLFKEHIFLMYACYRIGAIIAPLDMRLKLSEIRYSLTKMTPKVKAYFFFGKTPSLDFSSLAEAIINDPLSITTFVHVKVPGDSSNIQGAADFAAFITPSENDASPEQIMEISKEVGKRDPCLIIFTTGSTGSPKPALLCHENILVQNIGLAVGMEIKRDDRFLVNLPPSHVGCTTELLQTPLFCGCTTVFVHMFEPRACLDAIQKYGVTLLGQIPALFNMEWALPDYNDFDLSSLRLAIYGGQAVPRPFLEKMQNMAPDIFTGLGLTEAAGFCTYTDIPSTVDDILKGIGYDMPLYNISIREAMTSDGNAGPIKDPGTPGEICFEGPQTFLGYLGDPENTAKTISKDGILYTGDLGFYDEAGLHFSGRSKMVIKPKGYQVFPGDIENHISKNLKGRVASVAVVGAEHNIFIEGIMAFVEVVNGQLLSAEDVMNCCQEISAYSRPTHVEILKQGELPLNRVAKTDYVTLKEKARNIVPLLREKGLWDAR